VYGVSLALLSGHGRWGGRDVLADLRRPRLPLVPGTASGEPEPAARSPSSPAPPSARRAGTGFRGSRPPVSRELAGARGLRAAVGIGEAPIGLQATFSIWSDAAAVAAFARSPEHRAVVRRTRDEGWYGEELFARFTRWARRARGTAATLCRADAPSPLETVGVAVYSPVTLRGEEGR
jgi:hypothetical protein